MHPELSAPLYLNYTFLYLLCITFLFSARSQSAVRGSSTPSGHSEAQYVTISHSATSFDGEISLSSSSGKFECDGLTIERPQLELKLPPWDRSRPSSAASYDVLSNCSSTNHLRAPSDEFVVTLPPTHPPLPQKANGVLPNSYDASPPPILPPKTRPLGGLNVFTPSKPVFEKKLEKNDSLSMIFFRTLCQGALLDNLL